VVKGLQSPYLGGAHAQVVQGEAAGVIAYWKVAGSASLDRGSPPRQSGARPRDVLPPHARARGDWAEGTGWKVPAKREILRMPSLNESALLSS